MSALTLGYYPGCSGLGTSIEYEASTRAICAALDITLKEIPDWTCCGSTPAHTVDHALSTALAARNFAQAETAGIEDVVTPCPSCLKNLKNALRNLEDPLFRARVEALTERPLQTRHTVRSVLQVIVEDLGLDAVKDKVKRPLKGMKVVPYYGCLMTRPGADMQFDDPENPTAMDKLLESLGAEVLPFPLKTDCCGASYGIPRKDVIVKLSGRILSLAKELGADAVVAACPLCQMNLDLRQSQIDAGLNMPVPYFTQLLGWSLGVDEKTLGFDKVAMPLAPAFEAMRRRAVELERQEREEAAKAAEKAAAKASKKKADAAPAGGEA
jgi:heterodisulfide reductase subunit B